MSDPREVVIQKSEYWIRSCLALNHTIKHLLLCILHNNLNDDPRYADPTYTGLPTDPEKLYKELDKLKNKKPKLSKVLRSEQWLIILPPSGRSNSKDFDITILIVLIRHGTNIKCPTGGWKILMPALGDKCKAAFCIFCRELRNQIIHTGNVILTLKQFNALFQRIEDIAFGLCGQDDDCFKPYQEQLSSFRTGSLHPHVTTILDVIQKKVQTLEDEKVDHVSFEKTRDYFQKIITELQLQINEKELYASASDQVKCLFTNVDEEYRSNFEEINRSVQNIQNELETLKYKSLEMNDELSSLSTWSINMNTRLEDTRKGQHLLQSISVETSDEIEVLKDRISCLEEGHLQKLKIKNIQKLNLYRRIPISDKECIESTIKQWSIINAYINSMNENNFTADEMVNKITKMLDKIMHEVTLPENVTFYSRLFESGSLLLQHLDRFISTGEFLSEEILDVILHALANISGFKIVLLTTGVGSNKGYYVLTEENKNYIDPMIGYQAIFLLRDGNLYHSLKQKNNKEVSEDENNNKTINNSEERTLELHRVLAGGCILKLIILENDDYKVFIDKINIANYKETTKDNIKYLLIYDLVFNAKCNFHIKVISNTNETFNLTLRKIFIPDIMTLCHNTEERGCYYMIGHPFNDGRDSSALTPLTKRSEQSCRVSRDGGIAKKFDSEEFNRRCEEYLQNNFFDYNQTYFTESTILPPMYLDAITCEETVFIAEMFRKSLNSMPEGHPAVLIKDYNSSLHMTFVFADYTIKLKRCYDNRILLFYADLNAILNIRVTTGNSFLDLHNEVNQCIDDIAEFRALHQNYFENSGVFLIPLVVARKFIGEINVELFPGVTFLCNLCELNIMAAKDISIVNDTDDVSDWCKNKLNPLIISLRRTFVLESSSKQDPKIQKVYDCFREIISKIVGFMASYPSYLPFFTTNADDNTENLMLNLDQAYAVVCPRRHKIIIGPYGAGKSLVIKLQLEHLLKELSEGIFVYILSCDPYSIMDTFIEKHIVQFLRGINKAHLCKNVCSSNVAALGIDLNKSCHPAMSDVLIALRQRHNQRRQLFHLIVDEFNMKDITLSEADEIKIQLEKLPDSTVMLVGQSLQKEYVFEQNGERMPNEGYNFQRTWMEIIELRRCMRTTVHVHNAIRSAQAVVSQRSMKCYVPVLNSQESKKNGSRRARLVQRLSQKIFRIKASGTDLGTEEERVKNQTNNKEEDCETYPLTESFDDAGNLSIDGSISSSLEAHTSLGSSYVERERAHRLSHLSGNQQMSNDCTLTNFDFVDSNIIGHSIIGSLPKIIDLEKIKSDIKKSISPRKNRKIVSDRVVDVVAFAAGFEDFKTQEENSVIICNDACELDLVSAAFSLTGQPFVEYASYIHSPDVFPSKEKKQRVVEKLSNKGAVILTDRRSFRGMESSNVAIFLDREEKFESYQIPENMARSTSKVFFFLYGTLRNSKNQSLQPVQELVNILCGENLVEEHNVRLNKEKVSNWLEDAKTLGSPSNRNLHNGHKDLYRSLMHPGTIANPQIKGLSKNSCIITWISASSSKDIYVIEQKHFDTGENQWMKVATVHGTSYVIEDNEDYMMYDYKISDSSLNVKPAIASFLQNLSRDDVELCFNKDLFDFLDVSDNVETLKKILNMSPWRIHEISTNGWTLYHNAAIRNRHQILHYLCQFDNTHMNAVDRRGRTALHFASKFGTVECVDVLLKNHTDWSIKDRNGNTAYDFACNASNEEVKDVFRKYF